MATRKRNYKAEYERRIARGLAKGLSRSQARGHPKRDEQLASNVVMGPVSYDPRLEQGLTEMRQGQSLTASARGIGVSSERLKRYLLKARMVKKRRHRWVALKDERLREMPLYSQGQELSIILPDRKSASLVGRYMAAVGLFLESNDPGHLEPFAGRTVTDAHGFAYVFETRPNALYRLDASGIESFEQVYRIVM